jgi:hypothetical protein
MLLTACSEKSFVVQITPRGFTLEEEVIMAAMNLLTSADTAVKRENRATAIRRSALASRTLDLSS